MKKSAGSNIEMGQWILCMIKYIRGHYIPCCKLSCDVTNTIMRSRHACPAKHYPIETVKSSLAQAKIWGSKTKNLITLTSLLILVIGKQSRFWKDISMIDPFTRRLILVEVLANYTAGLNPGTNRLWQYWQHNLIELVPRFLCFLPLALLFLI